MLNVPNEKVLVEQCQNQNRNAQRILFDRYFKKMMTICLRYLTNEQDALEVLNNSFLKVFSKIKQFKSEGSLEGWIKRIVINSSIDFARGNKSYRKNFIHTNDFSHKSEDNEESNLKNNWFDIALDFSKEDIFKMVAELPPASRLVFNLYVIDGFSHKQIAENLKISEGTSKWHLSNARKILQEKIHKTASLKQKNSTHGE